MILVALRYFTTYVINIFINKLCEQSS